MRVKNSSGDSQNGMWPGVRDDFETSIPERRNDLSRDADGKQISLSVNDECGHRNGTQQRRASRSPRRAGVRRPRRRSDCPIAAAKTSMASDVSANHAEYIAREYALWMPGSGSSNAC